MLELILSHLLDLLAGSSARNIGTRVPPIVYFGAKCTYEDETRLAN